MRALLFFACLFLVACGGSTPQVGTTTPRASSPAEEPEWTRTGHHDDVAPGSLEALAVMPTLEEARASARAALELQVFGETTGVALPTAYREGVDPSFEARLANGSVAVLVAVSPERINETLTELAMAAPPPELRSPIADTFHALDTLRRMHLSCERRRALFADTCELPDLAPAQAALETYARTLSLSTQSTEGIPLDGAGRPRAALRARVTVQGADGTLMPLAHVPVRVEGDAAAVFGAEAITDAEGYASFRAAPEAVLTGPITLSVDASALFGALTTETSKQLTVPTRPASSTRVAIYIEERARGAREATSRVNAGMRRILGADAQAVARALEESMGAPALRTPPTPESARAIASRFGGRVDVLLVGRVESEFASRMGAHKVWFQASFEGAAYDLWTGRLLTNLSVEATASDFGDARADQAARAALAEQLVERLRSLDLSAR